ncbi:MAG: GxxExxY protein [Verrucomicrobia subdivision 3 bacterium]|nr:GxxExxY protein [Limisphaerales bacterium]
MRLPSAFTIRRQSMTLEFADLTEKNIGAAIEVHKKLGPGFLESVYENALVIELQKSGLKVEQQKSILVRYDGKDVGMHRLDLLVQDEIVIDLKTVRAFMIAISPS